MGSAKGPTSMSFKQQGLSNADTMNPYINEPGKSQKGEGETETAKVKGTVKPDRPQAWEMTSDISMSIPVILTQASTIY